LVTCQMGENPPKKKENPWRLVQLGRTTAGGKRSLKKRRQEIDIQKRGEKRQVTRAQKEYENMETAREENKPSGI